jgi:hypothetical protein
MKMPATLGLRGAKSKFDEFQAVHQLLAYSNHFTVRARLSSEKERRIES